MKSALVIIPTYNESENIVPLVHRVLAAVPDAGVLIVDDSSTDSPGRTPTCRCCIAR
jgi:dolichol-phosphate mannosyltransferase